MAIDFQGLDGVLRRIESMADTSGLESAMGRACALVERSAKQTAPKDTGALRNSITSEVINDGVDIVGVVFTPLEYAPYIEYGTGLFAESGGRVDVPWNYQDDKGNWHSTRGQKPQPFLRPALADNREKITRILKESMKND
jgi:HK97 gp10 family phage protein